MDLPVPRSRPTWAQAEHATVAGIAPDIGATDLDQAPTAPEPSTAEVRAWARASNFTVPDRGEFRPEIWDAWRTAHR